MPSRRIFMTTAALAAITPVLPAVPATAQTIPPAITLLVDLVNRLPGQQVFAHVTGLDRASGRWFFLAADAKTRIFPGSPPTAMTPLPATGIRLGAARTRKWLTIPAMDSGRIYFSVGRALKFFVNPGAGIVLPSVTNPADANADVRWAFCEFTLDGNGVYANISFVDFVSLALSLRLYSAAGQQYVGGLVPNGLARISAGLRAQATSDSAGWRDLIVTRGGSDLRVLSPNLATLFPGWTGELNGYLDPYIAQVWQKYRTNDLRIDTQSSSGTLLGRIGADGRLRFPGVGSFARPSSYAVFNCSVPPFVTSNDLMGNLTARIAAGLNRGTLLANARQPDATAAGFYRVPVTNHYARLVHSATAGGAGYAFPYDDVHADGYNTEGRVVAAHPTRLTIEVG